jgi:hypothetical protein
MRIIENCDCLSEADVMFMLVGLVIDWIPLKVHTLSPRILLVASTAFNGSVVTYGIDSM